MRLRPCTPQPITPQLMGGPSPRFFSGTAPSAGLASSAARDDLHPAHHRHNGCQGTSSQEISSIKICVLELLLRHNPPIVAGSQPFSNIFCFLSAFLSPWRFRPPKGRKKGRRFGLLPFAMYLRLNYNLISATHSPSVRRSVKPTFSAVFCISRLSGRMLAEMRDSFSSRPIWTRRFKSSVPKPCF